MMSQRILVVALNPALDITHELDRVDWSGVNRPAAVLTRPGGKGLNVARTLHGLGADVLITGLLGGRTGEAVAATFGATGVAEAFTRIAGETRRTFAVVDAALGQTALFNEPGPEVSAQEYASLRARYEAELAHCAAVVLTGSLPRGLPEDSYGELARLAAEAGVPVLLDAEGQALRYGLAARPAIVKPNLAELEGAVGRSLGLVGTAADTGAAAKVLAAGQAQTATAEQTSVADAERGSPAADERAPATTVRPTPAPAKRTAVAAGQRTAAVTTEPASTAAAELAAVTAAAGELRDAGAGAVVVSLGPRGLLAVTADGTGQAAPPARVTGNPTGAGDAVVAGLTYQLVLGRPWTERLRHATALGSAAAGAPAAGEFSRAEYQRLLAEVLVTRAV
jgi:tagatose 6-phosphate kinase